MSGGYELRLPRAARRALEHELALPVALAVWEFCSGPLRDEPRRVGKALRRELAGYFSARRGAYRIIYRLLDEDAAVHVVRIEHRADVYRRRSSQVTGGLNGARPAPGVANGCGSRA